MKPKFDLCIFSMCFVSFLSNSAYAIIAPFLPFEFEKNDIPLTMMGYIFRYTEAVLSYLVHTRLLLSSARHSLERCSIGWVVDALFKQASLLW